MTMTEMNAIRNAVRAPFVEKIVEAFPEAVNLMGANDYVIPTVTPDGEPCCVKISISVPTWFDTEKRKGFHLEDAIANAQAEFEQAEARKAENAMKRAKRAASPKEKVDNTAYDALVIERLAEVGEPITCADLYERYEWEGSKQKLSTALGRIAKTGAITAEVNDKKRKEWHMA